MTVKALKDSLKLEVICSSEQGMSREISSAIVCDLHSYVMANAKENAAWLTILGDINSVAVCIFSNISVLILTGDETLDSDAMLKAKEYNVTVLRSYKSSYQLAYEIHELLDSKN